MKNYLILFLLFSLSVSGAVVDYRALRQDQFTTNLPSPGYIGIRGSGITNISGTNINISAGGSIVFTTNGPNITITVTGLGQATNVSLVPGTNIFIATNGSGTFTISGLNYWRTNAAYAHGVSNLYSGPVVIGDPKKAGGDPNSILVVSRIVGSDDTSTGDTLLGFLQFATDVSGNTTLFGGDNNTLTIQSDGNMYFNGGTLYDFKNGSPMYGNGTSLTNLNGTNIDIVYDGGLTASSNGVHRVTVSINTNVVLSLATNVVNNNIIQGITGGTTNFATTNTSTGLTQAIVSIFGYVTNVVTTNTSAGVTNFVDSEITNKINSALNVRTNYIPFASPNTNTLTASIMFQTNGTQSIGVRNGDSPDGSASVDLDIFGHYVTENGRDWLHMGWTANGDYVILTKKGSSGTSRQLKFGTGNSLYWNITATGDFVPINNAANDVGTVNDAVLNLWLANKIVMSANGDSTHPFVQSSGSSGNSMYIGTGETGFGFMDGSGGVEYIRFALNPSLSIRSLDLGVTALAGGAAVGSRDTFLLRTAAFTWTMGTNNTSATVAPNNYTLTGPEATGSNIKGGDLRISGGISTGATNNGSVGFMTAEGIAAISTANTPKWRQYIAPEPVTLTSASAITICTISNITTGVHFSATIVAETDATDGSSSQTVQETFVVTTANDGGTVGTPVVSASSPMATYLKTGTLTTAWSATVSANGVLIKNTATSSLTTTSFKCRWRIQALDSDGTPAIYDAGVKHQ